MNVLAWVQRQFQGPGKGYTYKDRICVILTSCEIDEHFGWRDGYPHRSESLRDTDGLQSLRCAVGTVYWSGTGSIGG